MSDLSTKIMAALNVDPGAYNPLQAHTSWHVSKMLEALQPSDLTSVETMAMAIILSMAHSRKLSNPLTPIRIVPPLRENVVG